MCTAAPDPGGMPLRQYNISQIVVCRKGNLEGKRALVGSPIHLRRVVEYKGWNEVQISEGRYLPRPIQGKGPENWG